MDEMWRKGRKALGQGRLKAEGRMDKQVPWGRLRRQLQRAECVAGWQQNCSRLQNVSFQGRSLERWGPLPLSVIIILSLKTWTLLSCALSFI